MMRINLLPPEILERRKAERRIVWVALAAIIVAVVLAGVWGVGLFSVQTRETELASVQQQTAVVQQQADQLAIFEERATELEARRTIADQAMANRYDWARLFDEVSLVLPSDMWVQLLVAEEETGLSLQGWALDSGTDQPDSGHKSIAKALIRLADLEQLENVWLVSSQKSDYEAQAAIEYTITATALPTEGVTQ